jgi:glycosyltransferase involved in cell wall biosynthesis
MRELEPARPYQNERDRDTRLSFLRGMRPLLARTRARPPRVIIDARQPDERSGGVQQWVIGLASALSKLEGHEEYIFVIREGHEGWLAQYLGGRCRVLLEQAKGQAPPSAPKRPRGVRRLRRALGARLPLLGRIRRSFVGADQPRSARRAPPEWLSAIDRTAGRAGADVVHFPGQAASATRVPSIYQPWDLQHVHLPEFFSDAERERRDRTYRTFSAQAALVVVATKWVKADLNTQFGIAMERIAVVNPAPALEAYAAPTLVDEARITERLELPERYVFYPAQTWGHKNHERLFEALALLRDRGMNVPLVCSGHRNERYADLLRYATDLGLDGQVRFLGHVTPTEIQVLYRKATALVFPSLYEGWGLPILEAFASGLAVACSNVTSLPELVGDAALVFDPLEPMGIASAVERLWTDDALRAELVERGRARGAQFSWDRTARLMRAHYRRVAGRRLHADDRALIAADSLV